MKAHIFPVYGTIITGVFIFGGFVLALAVNLPGHLSYDSIVQLMQGRTGIYNTWHPPVMAWMLGIADALIPGAALFVVFDATLCFGALLSLLLFTTRKPYWPSAGLAVLWILSPQFLL